MMVKSIEVSEALSLPLKSFADAFLSLVYSVVYFKPTPETSRSKNTSRATSASGNRSGATSPSLESSSASLKPPSRRPRRSSSTDGNASQHDGPRKVLFVRPNQVSPIHLHQGVEVDADY